MSLFISLIIIEFFFIVLNILVFKQDILSPATISSIVFLIATLLALYCKTVWEINLSGLTVLVITLGLLTMTISELLSRYVKVNPTYVNESNRVITPITPNHMVMNVLAWIIFFATLAYGLNAYHTGLVNGGSSLNAFAYMKSAYTEGETGARMNPIVRQGFKLIMAGSYISCFVFSNNYLVLHQKLKYNFPYLIIIICSMVVTILSGSRTEILRILSALILDYALIWRAYHKAGNNSTAIRKALIKFAPLIIIIIIIAFLSRTVVKKTGVATSESTSLIYYVAYYVGSPIAVLNNKINLAFSKFDILSGSKVGIPDFVYLGNLSYGGNVGSIFQTKLINNGLIIMIIWILLIYFIGGLIYKRIKYNLYVEGSNRPLLLLLFNSWYYVFTMSYYSDVLSSISFVETNVLIDVVLLILYPLFFKVKIK